VNLVYLFAKYITFKREIPLLYFSLSMPDVIIKHQKQAQLLVFLYFNVVIDMWRSYDFPP